MKEYNLLNLESTKNLVDSINNFAKEGWVIKCVVGKRHTTIIFERDVVEQTQTNVMANPQMQKFVEDMMANASKKEIQK